MRIHIANLNDYYQGRTEKVVRGCKSQRGDFLEFLAFFTYDGYYMFVRYLAKLYVRKASLSIACFQPPPPPTHQPTQHLEREVGKSRTQAMTHESILQKEILVIFIE